MNNNRKYFVPAILYFLYCFGAGLFSPILSLYLKDILNFTGKQTGLIMSLVLISSILSPFIGSIVIDRFISKKGFLFICSILSSVFLFGLAYFTDFVSFLIFYVLFIIFNTPILGTITALTLDIIDNKDNFGNVRLFGTIGWIFASFFFGLFWINKFGYQRLGDSFIIASVAYLGLSLFSIVIKQSKPYGSQNRSLVSDSHTPLFVTIKGFITVDIGIILFLYFITFLLESTNSFGASPFLKQIGFKDTLIMPILSIIQCMEIVSLISFSFLVNRINKKTIFTISMAFQLLAFIIFAYFSHSQYIICIGLMLQGVRAGFMMPLLILSIDNYCTSQNRGAVHQLLSLISGISSFIGNNISGFVMDLSTNGSSVNFTLFWSIPILIGGIGLIASIIFKRATEC